jgi:anthranilate/para-aminobenzoate synthase component II
MMGHAVTRVMHSHHLLEPHLGRAGCKNPVHAGAGYEVVRYHSLMVDPESLPAQLLPVAWTEGGHHAVQLGTDVGSPLANAAC